MSDKGRDVGVITIKDEPLDPTEQECFGSAARHCDSSNYINPLEDEIFNAASSDQRGAFSDQRGASSGGNQNSCGSGNSTSAPHSTNSNSLTSQSAASETNTQTNTQTNSQTNTPTNPQTNTQTNIQTNTQTNTPTVIKSYSLANIPKFGEDGRVLTLGQRLALIQKKQEEEKRNSSAAAPSSVTTSEGETTQSSSCLSQEPRGEQSSSDRLNVYSGLRYNLAMKVLVTEEINRIMNQRGKEYYTKDGLRVLRFTKTLYPVYNECQIYLKGAPKQVLECLYSITEDLRKHFDRRRNAKGKAREETMLLIMPTMITSELLRFRRRKRVIQHVEENNGVWIQLDEGVVEGECVIRVTGHRQQMRDGLRQLLEELVTSPHAETLPSLFYYIPSPRHRHHGAYGSDETFRGPGGTFHGTYTDIAPPRYPSDQHNMNSVDRGTPAWLPCDRPQYHHWMTFRDYRF